MNNYPSKTADMTDIIDVSMSVVIPLFTGQDRGF